MAARWTLLPAIVKEIDFCDTGLSNPEFSDKSHDQADNIDTTAQNPREPTQMGGQTHLRKRMHDPVAKTGRWVERILKGHLDYYAVSRNDPSRGGSSPRSIGLAKDAQTAQSAGVPPLG